MKDITVAQFATLVKLTPNALLSKLREAGVPLTDAESTLSPSDKKKLLDYVKSSKTGLAPAAPAPAVKESEPKVKKKSTLTLKASAHKSTHDSDMISVKPKRRRVLKPVAPVVEVEPEVAVLAPEPKLAAKKPVAVKETELKSPDKVIEKTAAQEPVAKIIEPELTVEPVAPKPVEKQEPVAVKIADIPKSIPRKRRLGEVLIKSRPLRQAEKPAASAAPTTTPAVTTDVTSERGARRDSASHKRSRSDSRFDDGKANASGRKQRKKGRKGSHIVETSALEHEFSKPTDPVVRDVSIPESITVGELAEAMAVKAGEVIKEMMKMGAMVTINQRIDQDTASIVVEEMGHNVIIEKETNLENNADLEEEHEHGYEPAPRPPVVTIMGHVDHGKTSLLDYIRRTKVTTGEAGGITQHIGAYHVETERGMITFLDTPGHAAFTAMRARGAQCTDIVILVVAADDGVMPQTIEAIAHAKDAGVPVIVAVNKMDKPEADPERIKNELSQHGIIHEDWGGDVMFQEISAKTGQGVDNLLESILLQSEVLELTAIDQGQARGVVIESRLDRGRGVVATVLVTKGLLKKGDTVLAGREYGRLRMLVGDDGRSHKSMGPSMPVEILGLSGTPSAGDEVIVVTDERKAREVALFRQGKYREVRLARQQAAKLDNIFAQASVGEKKLLNIVLKSDVQGSCQAIETALSELSNDEVAVRIVTGAVGGVSESDVNLAIASHAIIIAFNVRAEQSAKELIAKEGVDIRYYDIIYELIEQVKSALTGMLAPKYKENILGLAEIKEVYRATKKTGSIGGAMIVDGVIKRGLPIRVLRDNIVIFEGELDSLRRFKDDVNEVHMGTECGLGVKQFKDLKVGDQIENFEKVLVERKL
jgi:translation initiation factor IF-2